MEKEKKSGAEPIEDIQPQEQREKPATPRQERPQEAPIVEAKPGKKARSAPSKRIAPTAEPQERAGSQERATTVGEASGGRGEHQGSGKLQESGEETGREIEGAKDGLFPVFDNPKKIAFLQAYIEMGGHVSKAARAARVDRSTPYNWLAADPAYKEAFERAREQAADVLEAEVIRRGAHGFDEPVFYQGKVVGQIRKYSDNLLMFMLKGLRPAKFRDNYNALGLAAAGDINIQIQIPRPDQGQTVDAEAREIPDRATMPVDNPPSG